jgi:hypothetical protein
VITSRIDRLPPAQQLTLKVASVIGRIFAFRLLHHIHPIEADKPQLHDYLDALDRLDITTVEAPEPDLAYIFKHIITQEVAYQLLVFSQRRQLHHAVAAWYERAHAADLSAFYPLLAHHWSKAEVADKALEYLEKAGKQAYDQFANQEAIYFFREALRLEAQAHAAGAPAAAYPQSPRHVTPEQLRRARWQRYLGDAIVNTGRLTQALPHLEEALRLLGDPLPATPGRERARLIAEVARQLRHRLRPPAVGDQSALARAAAHETARVYIILGNIYAVTNDLPKVGYTLLIGFNTLEPLGPSHDLALNAAIMAYVSRLISLYGLARRYVRLAERVAEQVDRLATTELVFSRISIHFGSVGEWQRARDALEQSIAIAERLQDRRQWMESSSVLNAQSFYRGFFRECVRLSEDIAARAEREGNPLFRVWALGEWSRSLLRLGDLAGAARRAEQALELVAEAKLDDPGYTMIAYGVLANERIYQGDLARARQFAGAGLDLLRQHPRVLTGGAGANGLIAEAFLGLLEASQGGQAALARRLAEEACRLLFSRTRSDLISRPGAWLGWGRYVALAGNPGRGRRYLLRGLADAGRYQMPYEAAMAHYELARLAPEGDAAAQAQRGARIGRAIAIFDRLGAAYHLERARALAEGIRQG